MTRALILAAGRGTRLRPLTDSRPKCLVPLLGKTLLARQIDVLNRCGITDIHIVAGYCADQIAALGLPYTRYARFASTNMVRSLFAALPFLRRKGDLIISYGDIIYQEENLLTLLQSQAPFALMLDCQWYRYWAMRREDPLDDVESLVLDTAGYVQALGKKTRDISKIQGQYTGLIRVRADKIPKMIAFYHNLERRKGKRFQRTLDALYMTDFLQWLIDAGWKIQGVPVENGWLEVDSVEDIKRYEALARKGELKHFCRVELS